MEIVAPAGSESGLLAAVYAGAGAVYLGLPLFGARAKAENFTLDKLKSNIDFAHAFNTRVFITLNTLIKDGELDKAVEYARHAYDCGADAVIVQDMRFIERLKRELPNLPLHASTQMGVHNALGAKTLLNMGVRRAVLARETLPGDIAEIKETGIEIEFFVQGALCVCFSGNCYFSSLASSYSGNRGKCMQLCRKPYTFGGHKGYYLSAKDICLYDKLDVLEKLGVDAVKIEGRMRSDEYVSEVVRVYGSKMPVKDAVSALKTVYNRGDYCSAYMDDRAPFDVIYPKAQSNIGTYIGKIDKIGGRKAYVRGFSADRGDGFKIMRGGTELGGAHEKDGSIIADCDFNSGDELRRTHSGALEKVVATRIKTVPLRVKVTLRKDELPTAEINANGVTVTVRGDVPAQKALSRAVGVFDVEKAFNKVADHPFSPQITVDADDVFLPVSALNELRRKAYATAYNELVLRNTPERKVQPPYSLDFNRFNGSGVMLMVERGEQISRETEKLVDYVVLNPRDYADFDIPIISKPILLNMPITARGDDLKILERAVSRNGIFGIVSNNPYALGITDKPVILGMGHNIIGRCDLPHIRSFEADDTAETNGFIYVYGYAPVMTLCHCPYGKCKNCDGNDVLTDEAGRTFKMRRYKTAHCYWQLLNCVPHDLRVNSEYECKNKFYDCTEFSPDEILNILRGTRDGRAFTRGNTNKGLK